MKNVTHIKKIWAGLTRRIEISNHRRVLTILAAHSLNDVLLTQQSTSKDQHGASR